MHQITEVIIPLFSGTDMDMTAYPNINMDGEDMTVQWPVPRHIRGPIAEFQILLKEVGKEEELVSVPFDSGK